MNEKKVTCPFCKSNNVRDFVYGLIRFESDEKMEEFKKDHVIAGCIIFPNSPAFRCDSCGKDFGNYNEGEKNK